MRTLISILLLAAGTCAPLEAQIVRGLVAEEGTGEPLPGAMIVLIEDSGEAVDRVLTDAAGRFATQARRPGRYVIRVDRIGYASLTTDVFDVPVNGTFRQIDIPIQPIRLKGLDVEGERRCEVRPEEGRVTAQVWEEARKALRAAAWTQASGMYRYTLLLYERELDRDAEEIVDEARRFTSGTTDAPFESVPIDSLLSHGFIQQVPDSGTFYHAPDAEAFLSDAFLDTHCFGVKVGTDNYIGLTFEPIEGREHSDIEGVLWLDGETAELNSLEFSYVNLPRIPDIGEPGGQVVFTRLPNGAWIVRDWWIRMPLIERTGITRFRRTGYRDEGGVAWRITDRSGDILLEASTASISGVVTDSIRVGPPDSPVTVEVAGTGEATLTKEDGSFLLTGLAEGLHAIRVPHPLLDTMGIAAPAVAVTAMLGEVVHSTLRIPTLASALRGECGASPDPDGSAPLLGRVTDAAGAAVGSVTVQLRWLDTPLFEPADIAVPLGPNGEVRSAWKPSLDGDFAVVETETDARGIFLLCDVPHGSRLRMTVTKDARTETRSVLIPNGADVRIVRVELEEGRQR